MRNAQEEIALLLGGTEHVVVATIQKPQTAQQRQRDHHGFAHDHQFLRPVILFQLLVLQQGLETLGVGCPLLRRSDQPHQFRFGVKRVPVLGVQQHRPPPECAQHVEHDHIRNQSQMSISHGTEGRE